MMRKCATYSRVLRPRIVPQKSTATRTDASGLWWTAWDGGLRGWTGVDVLPVDGMQEARGSSPLSSAGQRNKSKI